MFEIPMRIVPAYDFNNICNINEAYVMKPLGYSNIMTVNLKKPPKNTIPSASNVQAVPVPRMSASSIQSSSNNPNSGIPVQPSSNFSSSAAPLQPSQNLSGNFAQTQSLPDIPDIRLPLIDLPAQKGQKLTLGNSGELSKLKIKIGWNLKNSMCDIDVSAFMLASSGKVPGDDWFVFYGQTESPDQSIHLNVAPGSDYRETLDISLKSLNPQISKIVFVLTINEAFENKLNFSMVKDAYIQILDGNSSKELAGFHLTDYYSNVTSMMIGEIYLHNYNWKFNAIGNGVAKDLYGLCAMYGVQTD